MVDQMLQAWQQDIDQRNNISDGARWLMDEMESGWFSRLRAKDWRALTEEVRSRIVSAEGVDSFSAERENHEEEVETS